MEVAKIKTLKIKREMLSSMNSKRRVMLSKWRNLLRREREGRRSCLNRTLTPIRKMQLMGTLLQVVSSICFFATTETIEHVYYFFCATVIVYIFLSIASNDVYSLSEQSLFLSSRGHQNRTSERKAL